jgi:hypothetical protein
MTRKVILEDKDGEELVPYTELATNQQPGRVRPDGSSLVVDSNGIMSVSGATGTEIGYLSGVTSGIQGQLNANTSLVETTRQNLQTEINTKANSTDVTTIINNLLNRLWKVGSLYLDTENSATCPIADLIPNSQWELVSQDRALWGGNGSNANTTLEAGVPNITGQFGKSCMFNYGGDLDEGALYTGASGWRQDAGGTDSSSARTIAFDASRSNSIYGASSTVQPPAYRVNIWRRIA